MLRMVIADDEAFILECLSKYIPWENYGIKVVATAKNGVEALYHVKKEKPDILIADIKMPLLDGISLLERVKEVGSNIEVILISGFQEFEYARNALKHGCMGYVLKPIEPEELISCVKKAADKILKCRDEKVLIQKSMRPEVFISGMINDTLTSCEYLYYTEQYQHFSEQVLRLGIVLFEGFSSESEVESSPPYRTLMKDIEDMVKKKAGSFFIVEKGFNSIVLLFFGETEAEIKNSEELVSGCIRMLSQVHQNSQISLIKARQFCTIDTIQEQYWILVREYLKKDTDEEIPKEDARVFDTKELAEEAKKYIKENFSDPGLSLNKVAAALGVSPGYLSALFSAKCGGGLTAFINKIRLNHAKNLLESVDDKIEIIAESSGYENATYFSTLFKKETGRSPSEYRKNARK